MELRLEYDEILRKVLDFITWKNSENGRRVDMPKLDESHKDILFKNWDSWLNEVEQAIEDMTAIANIVIENVNENLHNANLMAETNLGFLPNAKQLELQWKQVAEERT